jgi:hypothetical protein
MRVRGIFVAALACSFVTGMGAVSASPITKIPPGQELLKVSMYGTAEQHLSLYSPSGALESRTDAFFKFSGSCEYLAEIAIVRPGYNVLCDAGKTAVVSGSVSYTGWNTNTGEAQSCLGTARFRPGAQWLIGGALAAPNVLNARTSAPFAVTGTPELGQVDIKSSDPSVGCTDESLMNPPSASGTRDFGNYRVNRLMPFQGWAENQWTVPISIGKLQGTASFDGTLVVEVARKTAVVTPGSLEDILGQIKAAVNGGLNGFGLIPAPGSFTITLPAGGVLHVDFSPSGVISHRPRTVGAVASAGPLLTIDQSVHVGVNSLVPKVTPLGRALLAGTASISGVKATVTFTPTGGHPVTLTQTFKPVVLPAIRSVQFTGSPSQPTIVVRGRGLAPLPPQNPVGSPTGHNGCPAVAGKTGSDYGVQLQINDFSKNWGAGFSTATNTSCIGLIPTRVTPNELDLQLGSFYTSLYPKFSLAPGDLVGVAVNGAGLNVHVAYGAPVTK